ncbi:hypothetical protein BGZ65_012310 [Modicella reniformis]|uniref:Phytocyanin domain-containing protein n=1 Tax=Modicella reniformis TaxID=1440133 RepID=A0A9P6IJN3_9FUNG|nr:hypothetical protein BGZ65_012310 [Modicella reniformis]
MRFNATAFTLATFVIVLVAIPLPPVLAAQTWDVYIVDDVFSPQVIDIAPGDTVRWLLTEDDDDYHAIVQTVDGPRSCTSKPGGFNSGRKSPGETYQQTFFDDGMVVNYKDGIGANCLEDGAMGTIYVGARPVPTSTPNGGTKIYQQGLLILGVSGFLGALMAV